MTCYGAKHLSSGVQMLYRHADVSWRWPVVIFTETHVSLWQRSDTFHNSLAWVDSLLSCSEGTRSKGREFQMKTHTRTHTHTHINPCNLSLLHCQLHGQTANTSQSSSRLHDWGNSIEPFLLLNLISQYSIRDIPYVTICCQRMPSSQ